MVFKLHDHLQIKRLRGRDNFFVIVQFIDNNIIKGDTSKGFSWPLVRLIAIGIKDMCLTSSKQGWLSKIVHLIFFSNNSLTKFVNKTSRMVTRNNMMWTKIIVKRGTSKFWGMLFCKLDTSGINCFEKRQNWMRMSINYNRQIMNNVVMKG